MATKVNKKKMPCNKPRRSPNPKKREWLKPVKVAKRRLFTLVRQVMVITIVLLLVGVFVLDTDATKRNQN